MDKQLTPKEQKLLKIATAAAYIEASRHINVSSGRKAALTRLWIAKHKKSIVDIHYARNRNPHWKKLKMKGNQERNRKRQVKFNYATKEKRAWNKASIERFLVNNWRLDHELAKMFKVGLPSIQARRRSVNSAKRLLTAQGKDLNRKNLLPLAIRSDRFLNKQFKALGK